MTTVIGIDPSITATAYARHYSGATTITYPRRTTGDERLEIIHAKVTEITRNVDRLPPTLVIIEDLPTHAHGAGITGMVQGVIRLACIQQGAPYVLVSAATLKKFTTGKGNASKADMRMAHFKRTGEDWADDNRVDAYWLRQIGLHATGSPDAIELPKAQREAILKVTWPADIARRLLEPYERYEKEVMR